MARLVLAIFLAGLLEAACRAGLVDRNTLVPPSLMATRLWQLALSGEVSAPATATFGHALAALALSLALGLPAAVGLRLRPRLRAAAEPLLASAYATPFFALYPVFVALLGMNARPIVATGVLFAAPGVVLNAMVALDRVSPVLLKVARVHRLSTLDTAIRIQLPAAAPHLVTAFRLGLAYSLIGVIAAEFILSDQGLGYAVADAYGSFDTPRMYAFMLLLVGSVTAVNLGLHAAEGRLLRRRGAIR